MKPRRKIKNRRNVEGLVKIKLYYRAEIVTHENKTKTVEGWYTAGILNAAGEIEKELQRGHKLRSIECFAAKGSKE